MKKIFTTKKAKLIKTSLSFFVIVFMANFSCFAQDQINNITFQYLPVAPTNGTYDTLVKVFMKIDFLDTIPVKKIIIQAGTTSSSSNFYNQTHNYKGCNTTSGMQTNSIAT